jgi:hypothetical protein
MRPSGFFYWSHLFETRKVWIFVSRWSSVFQWIRKCSIIPTNLRPYSWQNDASFIFPESLFLQTTILPGQGPGLLLVFVTSCNSPVCCYSGGNCNLKSSMIFLKMQLFKKKLVKAINKNCLCTGINFVICFCIYRLWYKAASWILTMTYYWSMQLWF